MGRNVNAVFELVAYIQKLSENDLIAFGQYIKKYRSSKVLSSILEELRKCEIQKPQGLLYRLISNQNSQEYKNYKRLKKQLFEFELSSKRIDFFRDSDVHMYLHTYLKKEIIAAQILSDRNAYYNSIQLLNETFKKATQYEMIDLQKPCASILAQFYKFSGDEHSYQNWHQKLDEIMEDQLLYERSNDQFEYEVHMLPCCSDHNTRYRNLSEIKLKQSSARKIHKISWMREYVAALNAFRDGDWNVALEICSALRKEYKNEPGLYPIHFLLLSFNIIVQIAWFKKRYSFLDGLTRRIQLLEMFNMPHRLPALYMGLCYLLENQLHDELRRCYFEIFNTIGYEQFQRFHAQVKMIELLTQFRMGNFSEYLKLLNRDHDILVSLCKTNQFIIRAIEVLSLCYIDKSILLLDKLESLRKFASRSEELRESHFVDCSMRFIRAKCLGQSVETDNYRELFHKEISDLRYLVFEEFPSPKIKEKREIEALPSLSS